MDLTTLRRVVLDTNCCIYFLDRPTEDPRRALLGPLMARAEMGTADVLVSTVTVTELLVKPLRLGDRRAEANVQRLLDRVCQIIPAGEAVAERAARLRADHRLSATDALICATAPVADAEAVLGNDRRWRRVTEVTYLHLDDLVAQVAGGGDGT